MPPAEIRDSVKSTSPVTENHYTNGYEHCTYSINNINTSNEDKNHDTNYFNKHTDVNHDTRKLHLWARHVERAVSVCLDVVSYTPHWLKMFLESSFHSIFMHVWFSLTSLSSLSTSTCPSPSSSTPLSWCTLSCTPTSTTWTPWKITCATPAKGSLDTYDVTVSPHRLWVQRHGLQRARQLPGSLFLRYPVIGPRHGRHYARQAAHRSTPRIRRLPQVRKVCPSVGRHCLSCSIEQGKLVGERNVDQLIVFGVTRNTYSAHKKFSENTQAEKMVDRTGKPVGESRSSAQIRTLFDEQRQMIIAEYCEKVSHHELQAARAEEETPHSTRRIMALAKGFSWSSSTKS